MGDFLQFLQIRSMQPVDIIDILIIWAILYYLLRSLAGTRTIQMAVGLFFLFAAQAFAQFFQLEVVSSMIGSLFSIIPIAIIVLFQDEIRRVLASIGSKPFSSQETRAADLDSIFNALVNLSKNEVGALIIIEGDQGLRDYIEGGTRLDALPSTELLVDIFQPKNNLHDGAVIFSENRIASAACLMPLSRNPNLPKTYGTRHRAAIGISEERDCLVMVVSEETGQISFVKDGQIHRINDHNISKLYELYNAMNDSSESLEDTLGNLKLLSNSNFAKSMMGFFTSKSKKDKDDENNDKKGREVLP